MIESQTPLWYETLAENERRECAAELTDAYFAALSTGSWSEFQVLVQQWLTRAAPKQLITA